MNDVHDDASAPDQDAGEAELEAALAGFRQMKQECEARIQDLLRAEDPAAGRFYAAEIFQQQQRKLRLEVEIEFVRKRLNRLRLGPDPSWG
jgi:hypothetical protein